MKTYIIISLACLGLLEARHCQAQMHFGENALFVQGGASVTMDGLTIVPETDLTLTNNTLQVSPTPFTDDNTSSIERVYTFEKPLVFEGFVGLSYDPSELNGQDERSLRLAGETPTGFMAFEESAVDTDAHRVFYRHRGAAVQMLSATAGKRERFLSLSDTVANRITAAGAEGKSVYGPTMEVHLGEGPGLIVFPNPVLERLTVKTSGESQLTQVIMLDSKGRAVFNSECNPGRSESEINVKSLSPGLYLLRATGADGRVSTAKVIKN
ncbi:T9SS type A sorting domain-containing protein [Dyadobacter sp. CY261]|uniref:T9SS type A sorting domain-containing protein n=1 Tax=Dyadobacter sp. CY261 TaxID=2907203 RepID=UPI001F30D915|nr:T9SS type A sorting domain-containing protein [Dyadobacter sp. CY261]MCF0074206.1 T9SS type A sorting domain-containing protein [Dyadobacter sp. CY261]